MLFEEAFMAMPEFLTGLPFSKSSFEGTVISAFSMAVLQSLNSRNIQNPVSCIRAEQSYDRAANWRADLKLDLVSLNIFTKALKSYGYYQNNWLEAKFCRLSETRKPNIPALHSTFMILNDLIRVCAIVPDSMAGFESEAARYFLHAYEGDPAQYYTKYRGRGNGKKKQDQHKRNWIEPLLLPGRHNLVVSDLHKENAEAFAKFLGNAGCISIEASINNICHVPVEGSDGAYYLVLTRIDDFKVSVGGLPAANGVESYEWVERKGRMMYESSLGYSGQFASIIEGLLS